MQNLTTTLIVVYGALLIGYTSLVIAYFHLRRKAQRNSTGQSGLRVQWWKSICYLMCAGLVIAATAWIIATANLFVHLASSWAAICPSLVTQDACDRAASDWQTSSVGLVELACSAVVIVLCVAYLEVKNRETPPERFYPLVFLTWSHGLLVLSWVLCTPLIYPLHIFKLVGTRKWTDVSSTFAILALLAYILGTTLWIIACTRISCALWYRLRTRTSTADRWPRGRDRDIALQDLQSYP